MRRGPALQVIFVEGLGDGNASYFDTIQIGCADAMAFGQQQRVVTRVEWSNAAIGARIVSHDGSRDGIGSHRIGSRDEDARLHQAKGLAANPRTLAAGNGFNSIDDGEIDWARGNKIGHDV